MSESKASSNINVEKTVGHLCSTFSRVLHGLDRSFRGKNTGPNLAYRLETEFAYRIHEVQVGPRVLLPENIAHCNSFIDEAMGIVEQFKQEAAKKKG